MSRSCHLGLSGHVRAAILPRQPLQRAQWLAQRRDLFIEQRDLPLASRPLAASASTIRHWPAARSAARASASLRASFARGPPSGRPAGRQAHRPAGAPASPVRWRGWRRLSACASGLGLPAPRSAPPTRPGGAAALASCAFDPRQRPRPTPVPSPTGRRHPRAVAPQAERPRPRQPQAAASRSGAPSTCCQSRGQAARPGPLRRPFRPRQAGVSVSSPPGGVALPEQASSRSISASASCSRARQRPRASGSLGQPGRPPPSDSCALQGGDRGGLRSRASIADRPPAPPAQQRRAAARRACSGRLRRSRTRRGQRQLERLCRRSGFPASSGGGRLVPFGPQVPVLAVDQRGDLRLEIGDPARPVRRFFGGQCGDHCRLRGLSD